MKHTQKLLMTTFAVFVAVSLVMAALFETDLLPTGILKDDNGSDEFWAATVMELLTLCVIPVALRLFKFGALKKRLISAEALLKLGIIRMLMLCVPMVANILLYYLYMNVAFGYMAIIIFLCLAFVLPTKARCEQEVATNNN
ncbi:hypothetical protein [Prevotella merdae]|uniref:hypothetical protein n=1 Tax=Prevotella merdae TaxID=2079531 RepID=UPI003F7F5DC0